MQLQPQALQRVRSAQFRPEGIATIFEHMAMCINEMNMASCQFVMDYQDVPNDDVQEGDLIPVFTISLRPATPKPVEAPA